MLNSQPNLIPPYTSSELPGIRGALRSTPEHFVVQEIPLYEPSGEGQHLYVNLTKVGLTTKELQRRIAKVLKVDVGNIGFAGMKDKHARTTQTFSLPIGHGSEDETVALVVGLEAELPVKLNWSKRHGNKLKTGHLLGNRFQITVSDLPDATDALTMAQTIVEHIREHGVANYFGPQRFGIDGANIAKGQQILLGKQWVKDRWLRKFLVSSYQSYLCNHYLARRIEQDAFGKLLPGDIAKKHETGGIFDVEDLATEELRFQNKEISFTAPMYGPKMKAANHEAGQLEAEVLEESGITLNHFRKAKVDGTRRLGRLLIPDIEVSNCEAKDELLVEFFLPKGAFATTVLREIMKVDLGATPAIE